VQTTLTVMRTRFDCRQTAMKSHLNASSGRCHLTSENAIAMDFGRIGHPAHRKDVIPSSKDGRQDELNEVCPERKLAAAVVRRAKNDMKRFRSQRRETGRSLYVDARNWIASNDRSWPYSFLNLCDALHLQADLIRAELLGETTLYPSLHVR
jgi:hypothetical protein